LDSKISEQCGEEMTNEQKTLYERIEKAWREQEPTCNSCGWGALFHELGPWLETDQKNEFRSDCASSDDPDCYSHRGVYVYLKGEK
jgi:hypothetical protein